MASFAGDLQSERGSGCPRNRFGLNDYAELQPVVRALTFKRLRELEVRHPKRSFDAAHLRSIHKYIFQDVFPWAGDFRVADILDGDSMFGPALHVAAALDDVLGRLAQEDFLERLDRKSFAARAAYFWGEINAIRPFREGNGRTQREFLRQLAMDAGHHLSWAGFSQDEMAAASSLSDSRGDASGLQSILLRALRKDVVTIIGTGLIGVSVALALQAGGFEGEIHAWDSEFKNLDAAYRLVPGLQPLANRPSQEDTKPEPGIVVLAGPVLSILDWMERLAPLCDEDTLVTDVGSTKLQIAESARRLFNQPGGPGFLPGHPMAGKESSGAAHADSSLFQGSMWLFTPVADSSRLEREWRALVGTFGARTMDLDAARHDRICAWVSHLPQMVATAMAAMFEDEFAAEPEIAEEFRAIGGRALREMTRLGASPYSMWRDVAHTNAEEVARTILALEQRLTHLREHLKGPELREEFLLANRFRSGRPDRG